MGSSGETHVHVHVCALLYLLAELNGIVVVVVVGIEVVVYGVNVVGLLVVLGSS